MKTICVFGASTVWGAWDLEKGGWVSRLRLFFDSQNRAKYWVYNLGVSGDTTNDLLERFDGETRTREPNIIIFSIGTNDAVYRKSQNNYATDFVKFGENIIELISKAKEFTDGVTFLGLHKVDESKTAPLPWDKDRYYRNKDITLYDRKLQLMAQKHGVSYLPMFSVLGKSDLEDGLHPNSQGHQKIFEYVRDFLVQKKIL